MILFNRPEFTRATFAQIREQRPLHLFIIADGPRQGHSTDQDRCAEAREVVGQVDWPCNVHRNYAEQNLGSKQRVSSGLDWVFSHVDRAIVLEDDCVPHPDFFHFCEQLLDYYADDPRVGVVTGDNYQFGNWRGEASYYFSKYVHVWGWATWKRAWDLYDGHISFWTTWRSSDDWHATVPDSIERRYWERILDRTARGEIESAWDYPWLASVWYHKMLTATPNVNLVTNIGFGPDVQATHTRSMAPGGGVPAAPLGPLVHPSEVKPNAAADRFDFDYSFDGARLRSRRRPLGFLRWQIGRAYRLSLRLLHAELTRDQAGRRRVRRKRRG